MSKPYVLIDEFLSANHHTDWFDCRNWASFAAAYSNTAYSKNINVTNNTLSFGASGLLNTSGNLTITSSGTVAMNAGGLINLEGNWTNNTGSAGFVAGTGSVAMVGNSVQHITTSSTSEAFNNLIINNTNNGNSAVALFSPVTVGGVLALLDGIVNTATDKLLSVTNTATTAVVGGSANSYIWGPIARNTQGTG
jgi:hypothetical protein